MRLLWVVNIPLAEARELWGLQPVVGGGWLEGAAAGICEMGDAELHIAFPRGHGGDSRMGRSVEFHTICEGRRRSRVDLGAPRPVDVLEELVHRIRPDVIHLWGTESRHALPTVEVARRAGVSVAISIQGLLGPLARHYRASLPTTVQAKRHWSDPVIPRSPRALATALSRASYAERRCLMSADLIIGRTSWDRAATLAAGATASYFHCDEIIRPEFWAAPKWSRATAQPFRIFVPQSHVAYKGLHIVLEAIAQLRVRFPLIHLAIAGTDPRRSRGPYSKYLRELTARGGLESAVTFLGAQTADGMVEQMLLANAFVLPSSIENSPNSLGEAMLLGVPSVASFVGGVPDMVTHDVAGLLYQADAPYMLAYQLARIFDEPRLAERLGNEARDRAMTRHDPARNTRLLGAAYRSLLRG